MTAVPIPKAYAAANESSFIFPVEHIRKNLVKEFATPMCNSSIIESSNCMKVYVRLRPISQQDSISSTELSETQNSMEISEEGRVLTVNAPKDSNKYKVSSRGIGEAIHKYAFTQVFQPDIGQKDFFDATTLKTIEDFIGGQDALIFTYGVTSSGKTYTMQGIPGEEGIIPRSIDVIFNSVSKYLCENSNLSLRLASNIVKLSEEEKNLYEEEKKAVLCLSEQVEVPHNLSSKSFAHKISVDTTSSDGGESCISAASNGTISEGLKRRSSFMDFVDTVADESVVNISPQEPIKIVLFVSFIEIYNEQIYDLLLPLEKGKKRPSLRLAEERSRPFVKNLREIRVSSRAEMFRLLEIGKNNLHKAETKLNQNSSRSHCIFTIKMVTLTSQDSTETANVCQLSFCDLAGSERSAKTNNVGERLVETRKINTSLLTLGKCVETLRYNQQHKAGNQRVIPFRESRLTRLFQNIMQGEGRASMIVNISQDTLLFDETIHVLNFSAIASQVKVLDKPSFHRHRSSTKFRTKQRSGSLGINSSSNAGKRFTIGWEPAQTPIKEQEETSSNEQEDEDDCSDSEECWEGREDQLLEEIENLKKMLAESQEKLELEREDRAECVAELNKNFSELMADVNESWEDRLKRSEEFGEKKYLDTVTRANKNIEKLQNEKSDLETRVKDLDQECDELLEKLNTLEDKYDEDVSLHEKIANLERNLEEKQNEINQIHTENQAMSKEIEDLRAETGSEQQKQIESLLEENSYGREIIKEQLSQIERLEKQNKEIESNFLSDIQKLNAELEDANSKLIKQQEIDKEKDDTLKSEIEINSQLNQRLTEACLLTENAKKESEVMRRSIAQLRAEVTELHEKNASFSSQLADKQQIIEESQAKLEKLQTEIKTCQSQFEKDRKASCERGTKVKDLRDQLQKKAQEIEDFENKFKQLNSENEQVHGENAKLNEENAKLIGVKSEFDKLKTKAAENESKMELLNERHQLDLKEIMEKNSEMEAALEEAIVCGEIKSEEAKELQAKLTASMKDQTSLKAQVSNLTELQHKVEEKLKSEKKEAQIQLQSLVVEKEKLISTHHFELKQLKAQHQREVSESNKNNERHETQVIKTHKKEIQKLERDLRTANDELESSRKELVIASRIEKEMQLEVEKLQSKISQLEASLQSQKVRSEEQPEKMKELEKDVHILTLERNDLLSSKVNLTEEISKLKKENENLKNRDAAVDAKKSNKLEEMEKALKEMDELQEKQQSVISKHEDEKKERDSEISQLQTLNRDLKEECQNAEKERDEARFTLKKFREARDKLSQELERQINTQKVCNSELKSKLEEQIEQNVKLRSENCLLRAEVQVNSPKPAATSKRLSETNLLNPSVVIRPIKQEVLHSPIQEEAHNIASPAEIVQMKDQSTDAISFDDNRKQEAEVVLKNSPDTADVKRESRSCSKTTSRRTVVRKTLSRKRRPAAARQATPIPVAESRSSHDEGEVSPLKTRRTLRPREISRDSAQTETSSAVETSDQDNTLTNEDVNKSTTSRLTEHERDFPKSEMEIDVTPLAKKSRSRKRNKQNDENEGRVETGSSIKARPKRKGRKVACDVKSCHDDDDDPVLKARSVNIARVGDMIKNSPVGQALKKFEAAMSPSRSPPVISAPTSLAINDPQRQSGRRVRKLHAEDISLPLQASPDEAARGIGAVGRGVGLPSQTINAESSLKRRLRRRK